MAELYASLLGSPFRAAIARSGGERTLLRFAERADDEYALDPLVWIDADGAVVGAAAGYMERSGRPGTCARVRIGDASAPVSATGDAWQTRELLAVVLRRMLEVAATAGGETMRRAVLALPAGVSRDERSICAQAALLAGVPDVEVVTVDDIVRSEPLGETGIALAVEAWDDVVRLTFVDLALDGGAEPEVLVLADLALPRLRSKFLAALGLPDVSHGAVCDAADRAFARWTSGARTAGGVAMASGVPRDAPVTIFARASVFDEMDATLAERLKALLRERNLGPERVRKIGLYGSWTKPFARALRIALGQDVRSSDERGAELDGATQCVSPQAQHALPKLASEIRAISESARPLRALAQGEAIVLLRSSTRLPATSVSETFASASFLGRFAIAAVVDDREVPLVKLEIPRYAERQSTSYLRVVVHCESARYLVVEVAYLYSTQRRTTIYDKHDGVAIPISDRVFRMIRS